MYILKSYNKLYGEFQTICQINASEPNKPEHWEFRDAVSEAFKIICHSHFADMGAGYKQFNVEIKNIIKNTSANFVVGESFYVLQNLN